MKKSKLIELLTAIEGNPDIMLWNGLVGDWMGIGDLCESELVKMTLPFYLEMCRLETCRDLKDWEYKLPPEEVAELTARYKKFEYECNQYVKLEDIEQGRYKTKRIVYIDAKRRGKTDYGRGGDIKY